MFRTLALMALLVATPSMAAPITLTATDGVKVFGDYEKPMGTARGTILLFHMAEASRAEYATIAPQLLKDGFATLAIDQRSGGRFFGPNQTVAALGSSTSYTAALPDLEAALSFGRAQGAGPVIVLGSSYSSALVFVLAARHPGEVAGVMSFSPGEYLSGISVKGAAAQVKVPVFITCASDTGEIAAARTLLDAVPGADKVQFVPRTGVHGASTLVASRNKAGAAENWVAVEAFLGRWK